MLMEFVGHFTRHLHPNTSNFHVGSSLSRTNHWSVFSPASPSAEQKRVELLHAILVSLNRTGISSADIQDLVNILSDIYPTTEETIDIDSEEALLQKAIYGRLTVALYANFLDTFLSQAIDGESEAEWWSELERSKFSTALYLLQTFPQRLFNLSKTIVRTLRALEIPLSLSTLSPSSLRRIFSSPSQFSLHPGLLAISLFPHLEQKKSLSFVVLFPPSGTKLDLRETSSPSRPLPSKIVQLLRSISRCFQKILHFLNIPLELTNQECQYKSKTLERLRDQRAEVLGQLAGLRSSLQQLISDPSSSKIKYASFLKTLSSIVLPEEPIRPQQPTLFMLGLGSRNFHSVNFSHSEYLRNQSLLRPSALTRLWPRLLFFTPLVLQAYASRTGWIPALVDMGKNAQETVRGFVQGWLVEPLYGVLNTVRAGGKGEVLVRGEGVLADLESLERMTLSLARDSLNYTPSQLEILAERVRVGDLTPVMEIYEEDIRTPLRSALTGTLLRNAFIQVQKAKVDIDQALSGIDHLLKSQELTFAFVGVAPAFAIVWAFTGTLGRLWIGGRGRDRWGGRSRRRAAWESLRRIERVLITDYSRDELESHQNVIAPLSTGLLILSLSRLRSYALNYLPPRIRAPFLEDLDDLEDTQLSREAKLRVVDRMWRCWGRSGEDVMRI